MQRVVPDRLFFSRLPSGLLEFSCVLIADEPLRQSAVKWSLTGSDQAACSLVFTQAVPERDRHRLALHAVLPADWTDSTLRLDLQQGSLQREVRLFEQNEEFFLPLRGEIMVAGGHRIGEAHRAALQISSQQFGWDLVGLEQTDLALLHQRPEEPPTASDFACFGQDVFSPGHGTVVEAVDEFADSEALRDWQQPSTTTAREAAGNHVIIRHRTGVHSCLAHLRYGSIAVRPGEPVDPASVIGALGNSGNSLAPHLHLHFMQGPELDSVALPVQLTIAQRIYAPMTGEIITAS